MNNGNEEGERKTTRTNVNLPFIALVVTSGGAAMLGEGRRGTI